MPIDINTQIRHLPYGTLSKLVAYLEPPSNKDWRALIRVMPEGRYSSAQVDMIKVEGSKLTNTCTEILLKDLCHLCVTVKELGSSLKKIENYEALIALDWPHEPVVIKTQPEGKVLLEGQDLVLRVVAMGFPLPKYQWYKNNEIITDEVTCELRILGISTAGSGTYKCVLSNDVNTITTNEVKVQVMRKAPIKKAEEQSLPDPKPVITTHPSSAHVLAGQHYKLQVKATGRQPLTYLWYKDGQPVLNSNSSTKEIRLFGEQDVGSYVCKVTNPYGDDISEVAELTIGQMNREIRHEASDKVALLIGNQNYTSNFPIGLGVLKHTIADTQTLGSLLHREDMGFNVLSFANLSRVEMQKAVNEYLNLLSEDCYAVFYFAGHGFELNGKHYLVPVDAPADWKQEDAICIQWILEAIWKSRPQLTVILLDMCRLRPDIGAKAHFEEYDFPLDLKIVIGFATCSQSESYERMEEENGIYMKYLSKHICRDVKIEDILHDVTTEVEEETKRCRFTARQRPEYYSKGGGYYSLRDPVRPFGNTSAGRWLQAHKLPEKRIVEFQNGVKVEVRFEHHNWLTNTINILIGVIDKGMTDRCNAYIYQLPNGLESHFTPEHHNEVVPTLAKVNPRSWPQPPPSQPFITAEKSTEMIHLQRLYGNLSVTIALESESYGERTKQYKVEVFPAKEFGLAQVFQT